MKDGKVLGEGNVEVPENDSTAGGEDEAERVALAGKDVVVFGGDELLGEGEKGVELPEKTASGEPDVAVREAGKVTIGGKGVEVFS